MNDSAETTGRHPFQAEVRQLLDIVIHSLYTDREIFVRELVSNAADSLEKLRLAQLTGSGGFEADKPLEVSITTDDQARTLTIADTGIGMTREELSRNLGTIAHSGTKAFLKALQEKGSSNAAMIGQFGVGFYSVFMVADRVDVYTRSLLEEGESLRWSSDGESGYEIAEAPGQGRGARVVVHLREGMEEFARPERIRGILRKYSNFVGFPIHLNGERVNTIEALWMKPKAEVSEEQYQEFYRFTAHAADEPMFTMQFAADAPLEIHSLLFVPGENQERFGFGQLDPGVALYCRKVLIDPHPRGLLPEWLRFLRGVIDSADLPLNISRESMQDSALVRKLGQVITGRFLKFLQKQAAEEPEKFTKFHQQFSRFIKEGIVTGHEHREALAGLLRFESSMTEAGKLTSFEEYVARMKDGQQEIYFLAGVSRETIEGGPYLEAFRARGLEVALFTEAVDEFVLDALAETRGKKLVSADRARIDLGDMPQEGEALAEEELKSLREWLGGQLQGVVGGVSAGCRLVSAPAAALVPEDAPGAHLRAMLRAMGQEVPPLVPELEINPRHPLVKSLAALRGRDQDLAAAVARQLADQALLAAGLVEQPQQVAARMNELLARVLPPG